MAARGVTPRPVTLRDFLELACDSSSDGFRSYPRRPPLIPDATDAVLQHLQQQQQAPPAPTAAAPQLLRRSPSRSASSLSLSLLSSLSRSFSRRIKEGFWRRRDDDEEADYFDDRDSCGFPSPLVSSCSASVSDESEYAAESEVDVTTTMMTEETMTASQRDKQATASTSSSSSSSSTSSSTDHGRTDAAAAAADGKKVQPVADGDSTVGRKIMGDDKQQLSPVSVLDFPFDDDDGEEEGSDAGTCSSPVFQFQRFTPPPDLHGTKQQQVQLQHKIGRYDGGDVVQGIEPVDLDARFTAATSESGESGDASTRLATTTNGSSTDTSSTETTATATRHDDDDEAEHQSAERSPSPSPHHHQEQEEHDDEYRLLARLLEHDAAAAACLDDEVSRVLVLDFFAENADRLVIRSAAGMRPLDDHRSEAAAEALVGAAAEWLRGAGPRWGIGDVVLSGKAALDDMERSRRWMCVGELEHDVGADVEGAVVDALLDELVTELGAVLPWWPRGGDMAVDEPGCGRSLPEC